MGIIADRADGSVGRRDVLAAAGTLVGIGVAGCTGGRAGSNSVRMLSAGSLARTFEDHVGPAFEAETGTTIHGEYYGTNAVMRMIEDRTKHPDVVVSADATLLRDRLYGAFTDWDVAFATNTVGIGYNADTEIGSRLDEGAPWYEVLADADEGDVAIGDPNLDPLGYRAVQAFELAEREHDLDGLKTRLLSVVYEEPEEPQMMAGVESGSRAAAIVYRNMALDHGMPFVEFPDAYNFGNPALADRYATVEFTTDEEGYTAEGRPVVYNATVIDDADEPAAGRRLVRFLVENPDLLADAGLTASEGVPSPNGDVPPEVLP